jgi:predicted transcriptional regulator
MKKGNVISTRVDDPTRERLDELCRELDRSQSWIISELIRQADASRLVGPSEGTH